MILLAAGPDELSSLISEQPESLDRNGATQSTTSLSVHGQQTDAIHNHIHAFKKINSGTILWTVIGMPCFA